MNRRRKQNWQLTEAQQSFCTRVSSREDGMEASKRLLVLVCLCCTAVQTGASSWSVQVPSTVQGLLGSCVVIPCTFNYPDPGKKVTEITGIWTDSTGKSVYHPVRSKVLDQYRDRTTLVGDVRRKNCSLKIDPLRANDSGPFVFRVEIADFDQYSYRANKVSVSIISEPNPIQFSVAKEVQQGQAVSATCAVTHSCPASPPEFTWSRNGSEARLESRQSDNGLWEATSTLTFHPSRMDHRKQLKCGVKYRGGQRQQALEALSVKYPPVNVKVEYRPDVKEGESVHLSCSGDAHPAVGSYEWHDRSGALLHKGRSYTLLKVSRRSAPTLYCLAVNDIGRARSSNVQLDVLYAPEIKTASSCSTEGGVAKCVCIVESSPRSAVHFVLADRTLKSTSVETHGPLTIWTLQADCGSAKAVSCFASNSQGHANLTLALPDHSEMKTIFIATGAAVMFLVMILIVVGVAKACKRTQRETPPHTNTTGAEKALALPQHLSTKSKDAYDVIKFSGTNASDHMYGNIEVDAIYANV
ncbi:unnamed protein product [Ophioblennius macclurei]